MPKYKVTWTERRKFKCSVTVEAESFDEAYDKASEVEIPDQEEDTMEQAQFIDYESCEEMG